MIVKKTIVYLIGCLLLLFGTKEKWNSFILSLNKEKEQSNKNEEPHFDTMRISYDSQNDSFTNNEPVFEIVHLDESKIGTVTSKSKTTVEGVQPEKASASS